MMERQEHHRHQQQQQQQQLDAQIQLCDLLTDPDASVQEILQRAARLIPALLGKGSPVVVGPTSTHGTSTSTSTCCCQARIVLFDHHEPTTTTTTSSTNNQQDHVVTTHAEFWSHQGDDANSSSHRTGGYWGPLEAQRVGSSHTTPRVPAWLSVLLPSPKSRNHDQDAGGEGTAERDSPLGRIDVFLQCNLYRRLSTDSQDQEDDEAEKQRVATHRIQALAEQLGRVIINRRTLQKQHEMIELLRKREQRLVESQNLAKLGQWELDLVNNSLMWSDAVFEIFRIDPTKFGASYEAFLDAIHPDDRKVVNDAYANSLITKKPYNIVHRLLFRSNHPEENEPEVRWVNEICRTEYHPKTGLPLYSVGVVQDITELHEMDRLKSAFLANMSHEIRTPLNAVMGYTDLMLMEPEGLSDRHRDYLKTIRQSGEVLVAVVSDILDISKIEAGQLQVDSIPYSPKEVLETVGLNARAYQANVVGKNVQLELAPLPPCLVDANLNVSTTSQQTQEDHDRDGQVLVLGDQGRLQQVLNNLIKNALKFTSVMGGTNGRVEYGVNIVEKPSSVTDGSDDAGSTTSGTKRMLEFFVSDDGVGIPEEKQESIFEAFHQVHPSRDSHELGGTGLGLTISKRLVELMGGEMRLSSSTHTVHHGTTFYFTVPCIAAVAGSTTTSTDRDCGDSKPIEINISNHETINRMQRSRPSLKILRPPESISVMEQSPMAQPWLPPIEGRVLVVDDNIVNLKLAVRIVNNLGYETTTSRNGKEAVDLFRSDPSIRLILMDKEMPVMDGLQAVREIRRLEREKRESGGDGFLTNCSSTPVVALTAAAYREDEEACLAAGCDDYLTKPVKQDALARVLSSFLRSGCPMA